MMSNLCTQQDSFSRIFNPYARECFASIEGLAPSQEGQNLRIAESLAKGELRPVRIRRGEAAQVVACDASVMKIAENSSGVLLALRGAIVYRSSRLRAELVGPFIRFVGYDAFDSANIELLVHEELQAFERRIQLYVASNTRGSLLLFDSALAAQQDHARRALLNVLKIAERNGNRVLAFSKESNILLNGLSIKSIAADCSPPIVIDITSSIREASQHRVLGKVVLARLSDYLFPFRVDAYPSECYVESFNTLIASDAIVYGYPETLALAHSLCTFSWLDVVGIQKAVSELGGILIEQPDTRGSILRPI